LTEETGIDSPRIVETLKEDREQKIREIKKERIGTNTPYR